MAKQDTVSIRTHMPMVATTSKGTVPRQYTKTSRNPSNGRLRVICCREMNETVGRAMAPVAIIRAATPYRAFRGFLCVVVRIVFQSSFTSSADSNRPTMYCSTHSANQGPFHADIWSHISHCSQHKSHGTLTGEYLRLALQSASLPFMEKPWRIGE